MLFLVSLFNFFGVVLLCRYSLEDYNISDKDKLISVPISFESGEQGKQVVTFPFFGDFKIHGVWVSVTKNIAATNPALITLYEETTATVITTTLGSYITIPAGSVAGKLQDVIEELCNRTGGETEKGIYTINSVCISDFDERPLYTINVTPNFSLSTPTFISVSGIINETSYETVMINLMQNLIPSITDGVSFDINILSGEVSTLTLFSETDIKIRVIDNEGNYSELTTITPTTC